ncbi:KPN_02809 family neutral zinc metallopeptidase [Kribbia dieselivorans]|uniref:KPN_02809 family neutral zinc metallopeptidase n=1 Tax=Kribbia dieselivorans TaxID=331526 RepID=UPI00083875B2|nr:neutral zinc metallopeptidase [Kribbia dieselivorans]
MSFNEGARIDTSNVEHRSGGGGGRGPMMAGGGGLVGLIVLLIALFTGVDLSGLTTGTTPATNPNEQVAQVAQCETGADANTNVDCRVAATANSAEVFWKQTYNGSKEAFRPAKTVIYESQTQSACGTASNQVGPFYCPLDEKIYIDTSFFNILEKQFGSSTGALAQEYVVAHEYGHHIQNLYGVLGYAQQDPKGAKSGGVRVELMADCFAGMWAAHAESTPSSNGEPFLKKLTEQDIKDALSAAEAVGDDRIQEKTTGRVSPENFTHGSAAQRQNWFMTGMKANSPQQCDTFATDSL